MRTVIVISRCLSLSLSKPNFHFKGFYAGDEIKALHLFPHGDVQWQRDEEYVLYVKVVSIQNGVLKGDVLRFRALDELRD